MVKSLRCWKWENCEITRSVSPLEQPNSTKHQSAEALKYALNFWHIHDLADFGKAFMQLKSRISFSTLLKQSIQSARAVQILALSLQRPCTLQFLFVVPSRTVVMFQPPGMYAPILQRALTLQENGKAPRLIKNGQSLQFSRDITLFFKYINVYIYKYI